MYKYLNLVWPVVVHIQGDLELGVVVCNPQQLYSTREYTCTTHFLYTVEQMNLLNYLPDCHLSHSRCHICLPSSPRHALKNKMVSL